jgi:hypothetical protein
MDMGLPETGRPRSASCNSKACVSFLDDIWQLQTYLWYISSGFHSCTGQQKHRCNLHHLSSSLYRTVVLISLTGYVEVLNEKLKIYVPLSTDGKDLARKLVQ